MVNSSSNSIVIKYRVCNWRVAEETQLILPHTVQFNTFIENLGVQKKGVLKEWEP